jgi:hypothetical protein
MIGHRRARREIADGATPYTWDSEGNKRRNDDWLLFDI